MAKLKLADYLLLGRMGFNRKEVSELVNDETANEPEIVSEEPLTMTDEVKSLIESLKAEINGIKGDLQKSNIQNDVMPEPKDSAIDILAGVINLPKRESD